MKNKLIPNTLIQDKHRDYVSVDHISIGIELIVETEDLKKLKLDMELINDNCINLIKKRSKEGIKLMPIFQEANTKIGKIDYAIYPIKDEDNKYRVILCLNHLNGNKLIRNHLIQNNYTIKEQKIINDLTANDARPNVKNFIPTAIYVNPKMKNVIPTIIQKKLPDLFFQELEFVKNIYYKEIQKLGLTLHSPPLYKILSIEINLDLLTLPGIEFASNEEVQIRLSRGALLYQHGQFIKDKNNTSEYFPNFKIPEKFLKQIGSGPYYDESGNYRAGIPALYGYFHDKSQLYVVTKEKAQPYSSSTNLHITLGAWLTRFEWRLTQNDKFGKGKLSDLIKDYTDNDKNFDSLTQFTSALNKLRDEHFKFLKETLNVESYLTEPDKWDWLKNFVTHIHPNSAINALFKFPWRINEKIQGIDKTRLRILENFKLVERLDSYYNQDYGLNWEVQPEIHLQELNNLIGDLQDNNHNLNFTELDFH